MITITKFHYDYLIDGHTVMVQDSAGGLVNVKFDTDLLKPKSSITKKLPTSLITKAGIKK